MLIGKDFNLAFRQVLENARTVGNTLGISPQRQAELAKGIFGIEYPNVSSAVIQPIITPEDALDKRESPLPQHKPISEEENKHSGITVYLPKSQEREVYRRILTSNANKPFDLNAMEKAIEDEIIKKYVEKPS